jgi:hypothetical protein
MKSQLGISFSLLFVSFQVQPNPNVYVDEQMGDSSKQPTSTGVLG